MTPQIHTYHCICSSLLLASTHTVTSLPRRAPPALDSAIILPLSSPTPNESNSLPSEGYTILLALEPDSKPLIIRKEDGFERRLPYRCTRCNLVVGYEIFPDVGFAQSTLPTTHNSGNEEGKDKDVEAYTGKILYLLPAGLQSTETMAKGREISEGDVDIHARMSAVLHETAPRDT
ncbi:hypothetical protein B0O99DRAFT_303746 [Bisporella sp. PMI_857]|nr:hypothetical protein B0O99DRAFT_303746 [Bisporella sp. PMI_857]